MQTGCYVRAVIPGAGMELELIVVSKTLVGLPFLSSIYIHYISGELYFWNFLQVDTTTKPLSPTMDFAEWDGPLSVHHTTLVRMLRVLDSVALEKCPTVDSLTLMVNRLAEVTQSDVSWIWTKERLAGRRMVSYGVFLFRLINLA